DPLVGGAAEALSSASAPVKVALIDLLSERRADVHLDTVLDQLEGEESVRMAVFQSLGRLAEPGDLSRLTGLLAETQNDNERTALSEAIVSISNEGSDSEEQAGPVLEALDSAPDAQKPYLLEILPEIGGEKAIEAAVAETGSSNDAVRQAALTALSNWPESSAIPPLLEAFQDAPEQERGKLLAGYTRLVQQSKYRDEDKVQFLNDLLNEASSPGETRAVMEAFAGLQSPEALQAVARHFDDEDEDVQEVSLRSAAHILSASSGEADLELSLIEATTSSAHKESIEQYMQQLQSGGGEEANFTSLFNGSNLSGWVGDTDSYTVSGGQITSNDGAAGNLFTEQEYSNFILRFEFKLTPGANNGLAIRSPLEGNPAYEGMELQIID